MGKQFSRALLLSIAALFVPCTAAQAQLGGPVNVPPTTRPAGEADVPVKEVVLFSSGVGYFEHFGSIKGDGTTVLRFKTDQINDILKSLVLEDLDGGKVGTVSYPSQAPIAKTLKSFQVDITSNPPLPELLNQLRGARLSVTTAHGEKYEGIVLGVEKKRKAVGEKEIIETWVLNLRSGRTIRPVPLDDVQNLEMDDAKLNQELDAALASLAQARDQEKKPVTIHFNGAGDRRVRVGYVVETPIWKTSYRLILSDAKKPAKPGDAPPAGAKLQGWAIVENQTDNDWDNVQLSLISGRPISFIEDLYHSLYVPRPFVEPRLFANLQPQTYENGITKQDMDKLQNARAQNEQLRDNNNDLLQQARPGGMGGQAANQLFANSNQAGEAASTRPIDPTASVVAAASASKLGELFQYTVGSVSIKRQQSAMIPIVTDDVDATKVSIYNRSILENHPLNGARLKNTTHKHLLQGPVTVIEAGSYAGDARIEDLPPGQQRLLSYGVDLKVLAQTTDGPQETSVHAAKLVKGVLNLTWKDVAEQTYLIDNKSDHEKIVIVEHPRQEPWKLLEPAKADETTEALYRFERVVPAFKPAKLLVRQEMIRAEEIQLTPLEPEKLELYVKLGAIPDDVRKGLAQIIVMKQTVSQTQAQITRRNAKIAEITAEQARIRENMKTVTPSNDYYARLVKKLDEQETTIEGIQKEIKDQEKELETRRKALDSFLNGLTVG